MQSPIMPQAQQQYSDIGKLTACVLLITQAEEPPLGSHSQKPRGGHYDFNLLKETEIILELGTEASSLLADCLYFHTGPKANLMT